MRSQAGTIFATASPQPAWAEPAFQGRRIYLRCKQDACIPAPVQDALIDASEVEWRVVELDTGHCPFFGMPDKLGELLVGYVEEFSKGE